MSREEWCPVVGEEGYYEVSDRGRVRSLDRVVGTRKQRWKGRMLKPTNMGRGYVGVALRGRNKQRVHQLVARTFLGECPPGQVVCHNDGNPGNNRLENLRYDTQASNCRDTVRHGRSTRGADNPAAKLTANDVRAIRLRLVEGHSVSAVAKVFRVTTGHIYGIRSGRTWAWLQ